MGSSPARNVGSSLSADQSARARQMAKDGWSARPALTAACASSSSTELREGGGQPKICWRIVSVGLDRPSAPRGRLLVTAELVLRDARECRPGGSCRIARTEAQRIANVSLCFFGATDINLTKSDIGMGLGEISIQRQRMFTFGDALCRALGAHVDKSQQHMARRMVRDRGQGFSQFRFGRSEGRHRIGQIGKCALDEVRPRRSNERVDMVGIGGERAIEKAARLRDMVRGRALIEPSQTLKIEVHRVQGSEPFPLVVPRQRRAGR